VDRRSKTCILFLRCWRRFKLENFKKSKKASAEKDRRRPIWTDSFSSRKAVEVALRRHLDVFRCLRMSYVLLKWRKQTSPMSRTHLLGTNLVYRIYKQSLVSSPPNLPGTRRPLSVILNGVIQDSTPPSLWTIFKPRGNF